MRTSISYILASEVLLLIKSVDRVFVDCSGQLPTNIMRNLVDQAYKSILGEIFVNKMKYVATFNFNTLNVSVKIWKDENEGRSDNVLVFLSEIIELFKRNLLPVEVVIIKETFPDKHGCCF
jgi:hypothetical protein